MKTPIPRFQGNAIQRPNKSWTWELKISIGGKVEPLWMESKEEFINRESALKDLKKHVPDVAQTVCKAMGLPKIAGFHDLVENELVPVDEYL